MMVCCACATCPCTQLTVRDPAHCHLLASLRPKAVDAKPFAGKTVVLIRTSSTARVPVYQRLKDLGLRIIMVSPIRWPEFDGCISDWIDCDTHDPDVLRQTVMTELAALDASSPDAIISFDEYGVFPASLLAAHYGKRALPFGPEQLRSTNLKGHFRDWCEAHGLTTPRHVALHDANVRPSDAVARRGMRYPVVAKPSPGAGSLFAKCCDSAEDLDEHVGRIWSAMLSHKDTRHIEALGRRVHVAIEEFITGQEVDLDCVIENGRVAFCAVSDNFATQPPYFAEVGGCTPSALPPRGHEQLRKLLDDYAAAVGPELHGVLHFEAKYDEETDVATVIEVNCRMGSAETFTMVKTAFGVDLAECFIRLALDMPLDRSNFSDTPLLHCASVNIYPKQEGTLACVHEPHADEQLIKCCVQPTPGAALKLPPNGFGCAAWMVATGASSDEARRNIDRFTSEFKLCVGKHREEEGNSSAHDMELPTSAHRA